MTNNSTIVPEMGSGKWADALAKDPDESASWTADAESVPELPGADVASLSRYKEEIDSQIAELDATMKEAEARVAELQQKLASMARYSTDREVAANRLEAGAGTGEYEAMRQRESSDAEKEATEKKAAEDASKVSEIEKQYKIADAIDTLNTDSKSLKDARTTVNAQNTASTPAERNNNSVALEFATSQLQNDLKKAALTGVSDDDLAIYKALLGSPVPSAANAETPSANETPVGNTAGTSVTKEYIDAQVKKGSAVKAGTKKKVQVSERSRLTKLFDVIDGSNMNDDDKSASRNEVEARIAEILAYPTAESIAKEKTDAERIAAAEKAKALAALKKIMASYVIKTRFTGDVLKALNGKIADTKIGESNHISDYYKIRIDEGKPSQYSIVEQ